MPLLSYATSSMAAGLLGWSATRLATAGCQVARGAWRANKFRGERQNRLRRETQHARLASELNWQSRSPAGLAWRVVDVVEIVDESDDCRSFYLRDPAGGGLPDFRPGQFVAVRPALGGSGVPTRCYSLSDSPGQSWWRITVKRVAPASPAERGGLSAWLHDRIGVGDCLLVHGPSGEFTLDTESSAPVVLLGAGIGITPLVSMLKHVLEHQPARPVHLFFQAQDERHWPFGPMLHAWQADCPNLRVTSYFSRGAHRLEHEQEDIRSGKFDARSVLAALDVPTGAQLYLCGPDAWMSALTEDLQACAIARDRIHFESFGASPPHDPADDPIAVEPWSVRFSASSVETATSTEPKSIWQAAKEQGLELPAVCHTGACGTCRLRLRQGEVRYASEPSARCQADEVLACVAQPVGQVIVDA